ncbi:GNAT family N-acetyltransferase [Methylobacterium sp. NEAU 140]|uniref:GNAT family N-acetyltransferase n=1 Tax=Methylobacterium sp. NEAU 140 TaxID=3064945 RepID=UPI00273239F0|nr:GNAT family N-acetyltransferase [Methylobacterium sp. NEAU 140]MDP4025284.1 GNAT family N-acetyltransferase [Methylobacterium sp. NEAU 140]
MTERGGPTATTAAAADPDRRPAGQPGEPQVLALHDYLADDGTLRLRDETAAGYADPAPGGLYAHPAWLRAYAAGDLVVVEGLRPGVPRLVFARAHGGLVHRGCLLRLEAALVAGLSERLMARTGAAFAVFEDVEILGPVPARPARLVFNYRNNWRLDLRGPAWASKRLVADTRRKARGLRRDVPDVTIDCAPAPDRAILDRIATFGRARIEARGRQYLIDAAELDRLATVAAAVGHSTLVRSGDALLAADLVCTVGDQAYFLTHGFDPGYPRSRLGLICLINSIEACAARGVHDFNMLWGDQPYKAQLGGERVDLRTVLLRRSAAGLLHPGHARMVLRFGWLDLKRRLKPYLEPALERLRSRWEAATRKA